MDKFGSEKNIQKETNIFNKHNLILIGLAGVILITSLFIFSYLQGPEKSVLEEEPFISNNTTSRDSLNSLIENRAEISFPETKLSKAIESDNLPDSLRFLIITDSTNIRFEELSFIDGRVGYRINYDILAESLTTHFSNYSFFRGFLTSTSNDWQATVGSRTTRAAIIEFNNSKYQARFEQLTTENNGLEVNILIVEKP